MDTTNLGSSGLRVSRIALGCMSFGDPGRGGYSWTLPEEQAAPFFRQAVELGITFWDTANAYSDGSSEELVGRAINEYASREDDRPRDQAVLPDARRARRVRAVPQSDDGTDRRLAAPARHRLRRPLPGPPLRPRDAGRGDHGGPARRRPGREGALPRRLLDVGVAVREAAARGRAERLDPVRVDAEPVQPAATRGGTRDVRPARRPGRRQHPVEPARPGPALPALGRDFPPRRRRLDRGGAVR